jgi:hypothetical protein
MLLQDLIFDDTWLRKSKKRSEFPLSAIVRNGSSFRTVTSVFLSPLKISGLTQIILD